MIKNEKFIVGFTTGACAQAAAKACAIMLVNQKIICSVDVELPNKEVHSFKLINQSYTKESARCGVIKDSGCDTEDVTNGIEIQAEIKKSEGEEITLFAGKGVGVVTLDGLAVEVGQAAINPVPRKMILRDLTKILPPDKGFSVNISVPQGETVAAKTYNPRLGVKGGISIIGTRGTVEPKSQQAYKASLNIEFNVLSKRGVKTVFLACGNISERVLRETYRVSQDQIISVGDYVGYSFKQCVSLKISKIVFIGHIGKLSKVAAGLFNTHCSYGDSRLETIAAYSAVNGASPELVTELLSLKLAQSSVELLRKNNLMKVYDDISKKAWQRLDELCHQKVEISVIILSLSGEIIGSYPKGITNKQSWEKFIL